MLASLFSARYLPDMIALAAVSAIQFLGMLAILAGPAAQARRSVRGWIVAAWTISQAVLVVGMLLRFSRVTRHFPPWVAGWGRGAVIIWAFFSVLMLGAYFVLRLIPAPRREHSPARRSFLFAARAAVLAGPVAATAYGTFVQRFDLRRREADLAIPGLPKDLEGLRIAQLSDIHLSPFLSVKELERAVAMANEIRPHLALITGDLITTWHDPLDDCLAALAQLRADAGIFGCMGNHEIYANSERYTKIAGARLGMDFLRQESRLLHFGDAALNLAGVDYQRFGKPYLVGAEKLIAPGAVNLLMSHNPDVFPVAARKGFAATIAGHTHGGQVRFEILHADLNIARFFTPYVDGLYRHGDSSIFVSRGIGTIGLPARLGAPPEVALLRLCRS